MNSENDKFYFIKIKVKKNKKMKKTESFLEVAKSDLTNNEVFLEPPSTIEKIRTLIITMICLVITLFIAVFIFLRMD